MDPTHPGTGIWGTWELSREEDRIEVHMIDTSALGEARLADSRNEVEETLRRLRG
jgi:hypothetical protein